MEKYENFSEKPSFLDFEAGKVVFWRTLGTPKVDKVAKSGPKLEKNVTKAQRKAD